MINIKDLLNITNDEIEAYRWYKQNGCFGYSSQIAKCVKFESLTNGGDLYLFSNMSNSGILPILCSFPNFTSAYNFILSFRPGFIYTLEFQYLLKKFLKCKKYFSSTYCMNCRRYTLDNYIYKYMYYPKDISSGEDIHWEEVWLYNGNKVNSHVFPAVVTNISKTFFKNNYQRLHIKYYFSDIDKYVKYIDKFKKDKFIRINYRKDGTVERKIVEYR